MPVSITELTSLLSTLKGGSAYYSGKLGAGRNVGIKELGPLVFPLNKIQINALIDLAHTAPFGKGHQTLVDRSVRNTWEIDADQLDISDAKLKGALKTFLDEAASEMNVQGEIIAKPYKLLIYEEGGFFVEHQDSEKLPGMFGTLLVGLPCAHAGGKLTIEPGNGEKIAIDFSKNNAKDFPAVAFFADRKHEVAKVTEGHRVVLVYNLVYADGEMPPKVNPQADAEALSPILSQLQETDAPVCLALDHQYTDTNFSTGQLKGNDVVRVAAIRKAAAMAGISLRVGLIEEQVSANWDNADAFGQGYSSGYWSRSSRYDSYSSSSDPKSFAEVEPGESFEDHLIMSNWLPEDGAGIGELQLEEENIVAPPDRPQQDPIEWSVEGYQGNWGMTTDFTYRYAGVLLWHPGAMGKIIGKMPLTDRLRWVTDALGDVKDHRVMAQSRGILVSVANTLQASPYNSVDFGLVGKLLLQIGGTSPDSAEAVFAPWKPVLERDFERLMPSFWPAAVGVFGADAVESILQTVVVQEERTDYRKTATQPPQVMAIIRELLLTEEEVCHTIAQTLLEHLGTYLERIPVAKRTGEEYCRQLIRLMDVKPTHTLWADTESVRQLLPDLKDPDWIRETLAPTLLKEDAGKRSRLLEGLLENLQARTVTPPKPYTDFVRPLPKGFDKPEGKYAEVLEFLLDPEEATFDYKRPQAERSALENFIRWNNLDLKGTTVKTRPSHTLRLTKTDASYHRLKKEYARDVKLYERLVELGGK